MVRKMKAGKKNRKWINWGLGAALVMIAVALVWYFGKRDLSKPGKESKAKLLLSDQFRKMIAEASDSLYRVDFSAFDVNIDSGRAYVSDLKLTPDSAVYTRLLSEGRAPDNVFKVNVPKVVIEDFGFVKGDSVVRFNIERMLLRQPSVTVSNKLVGREDSIRKDGHGALYKLAQKLFKRMSVGKVYMDDLDFMYVNKNGTAEKYNLLSNLNVVISDFNTSPAEGDKGGVIARTGELRLATPDSLYYLVFQDMSFSAPERRLFTGHFSLLPRLSKAAFYQAVKYSKDRYHFEYDKISMNDLDLKHFLRTQQIRMGSINIASSWVEVYTDYNWPARKVPERRNAFPHDQLQTLAFDITIDTMTMKRGDIFFRIRGKNSKKVSTLSMERSSGQFFNITNNASVKRRNPFMRVKMTTRVMNEGLMNVNYTFNLKDPSAPLTLYSTMGAMDARALNPLSEPLGLMHVRSGRISKMKLLINMDEYRARGNLDFYYQDVKVDFLKRDEEKGELKKEGTEKVLRDKRSRRRGFSAPFLYLKVSKERH
ncbi:hypothetical protein [Arcticibacter sp. MXS-1]|uniref:hypothetical protein n=1 Tax=Arcticibacter sp. MXS-1 TaxID=3341726 RepID=UPI0035A891FE